MERVKTEPVEEEGVVVWVKSDWPVDVVFKLRLVFLGLLLSHTLGSGQVGEVVGEAVGVVPELPLLPAAPFTPMVVVLRVLLKSLAEGTRVASGG